MKTLLCVDDDEWVLETLHEALQLQGYRVLTTKNAAEAPAFLRVAKVDLVLLDLNMPGKNGFTVFGELRAVAPVPILFVSACSRSFNAESPAFLDLYQHEFREGRADILFKPFALSLLFEKVEAMLGEGVAA